MGNRRLTNEEVTVNQSTGEVLTIRKNFTIKTTTEEFFMTFISNMASFFKISSVTDIKILAFLCRYADFNTGHVSLTTQKRQELIKQLQLNNRQTVSNSFRRLKDLGLIAGEDGEYDLDPRVFWKGSTDERTKFIKNNQQEINIKFTPKD